MERSFAVLLSTGFLHHAGKKRINRIFPSRKKRELSERVGLGLPSPSGIEGRRRRVRNHSSHVKRPFSDSKRRRRIRDGDLLAKKERPLPEVDHLIAPSLLSYSRSPFFFSC